MSADLQNHNSNGIRTKINQSTEIDIEVGTKNDAISGRFTESGRNNTGKLQQGMEKVIDILNQSHDFQSTIRENDGYSKATLQKTEGNSREISANSTIIENTDASKGTPGKPKEVEVPKVIESKGNPVLLDVVNGKLEPNATADPDYLQKSRPVDMDVRTFINISKEEEQFNHNDSLKLNSPVTEEKRQTREKEILSKNDWNQSDKYFGINMTNDLYRNKNPIELPMEKERTIDEEQHQTGSATVLIPEYGYDIESRDMSKEKVKENLKESSTMTHEEHFWLMPEVSTENKSEMTKNFTENKRGEKPVNSERDSDTDKNESKQKLEPTFEKSSPMQITSIVTDSRAKELYNQRTDSNSSEMNEKTVTEMLKKGGDAKDREAKKTNSGINGEIKSEIRHNSTEGTKDSEFGIMARELNTLPNQKGMTMGIPFENVPKSNKTENEIGKAMSENPQFRQETPSKDMIHSTTSTLEYTQESLPRNMVEMPFIDMSEEHEQLKQTESMKQNLAVTGEIRGETKQSPVNYTASINDLEFENSIGEIAGLLNQNKQPNKIPLEKERSSDEKGVKTDSSISDIFEYRQDRKSENRNNKTTIENSEELVPTGHETRDKQISNVAAQIKSELNENSTKNKNDIKFGNTIVALDVLQDQNKQTIELPLKNALVPDIKSNDTASGGTETPKYKEGGNSSVMDKTERIEMSKGLLELGGSEKRKENSVVIEGNEREISESSSKGIIDMGIENMISKVQDFVNQSNMEIQVLLETSHETDGKGRETAKPMASTLEYKQNIGSEIIDKNAVAELPRDLGETKYDNGKNHNSETVEGLRSHVINNYTENINSKELEQLEVKENDFQEENNQKNEIQFKNARVYEQSGDENSSATAEIPKSIQESPPQDINYKLPQMPKDKGQLSYFENETEKSIMMGEVHSKISNSTIENISYRDIGVGKVYELSNKNWEQKLNKENEKQKSNVTEEVKSKISSNSKENIRNGNDGLSTADELSSKNQQNYESKSVNVFDATRNKSEEFKLDIPKYKQESNSEDSHRQASIEGSKEQGNFTGDARKEQNLGLIQGNGSDISSDSSENNNYGKLENSSGEEENLSEHNKQKIEIVLGNVYNKQKIEIVLGNGHASDETGDKAMSSRMEIFKHLHERSSEEMNDQEVIERPSENRELGYNTNTKRSSDAVEEIKTKYSGNSSEDIKYKEFGNRAGGVDKSLNQTNQRVELPFLNVHVANETEGELGNSEYPIADYRQGNNTENIDYHRLIEKSKEHGQLKYNDSTHILGVIGDVRSEVSSNSTENINGRENGISASNLDTHSSLSPHRPVLSLENYHTFNETRDELGSLKVEISPKDMMKQNVIEREKERDQLTNDANQKQNVSVIEETGREVSDNSTVNFNFEFQNSRHGADDLQNKKNDTNMEKSNAEEGYTKAVKNEKDVEVMHKNANEDLEETGDSKTIADPTANLTVAGSNSTIKVDDWRESKREKLNEKLGSFDEIQSKTGNNLTETSKYGKVGVESADNQKGREIQKEKEEFSNDLKQNNAALSFDMKKNTQDAEINHTEYERKSEESSEGKHGATSSIMSKNIIKPNGTIDNIPTRNSTNIRDDTENERQSIEKLNYRSGVSVESNIRPVNKYENEQDRITNDEIIFFANTTEELLPQSKEKGDTDEPVVWGLKDGHTIGNINKSNVSTLSEVSNAKKGNEISNIRHFSEDINDSKVWIDKHRENVTEEIEPKALKTLNTMSLTEKVDGTGHSNDNAVVNTELGNKTYNKDKINVESKEREDLRQNNNYTTEVEIIDVSTIGHDLEMNERPYRNNATTIPEIIHAAEMEMVSSSVETVSTEQELLYMPTKDSAETRIGVERGGHDFETLNAENLKSQIRQNVSEFRSKDELRQHINNKDAIKDADNKVYLIDETNDDFGDNNTELFKNGQRESYAGNRDDVRGKETLGGFEKFKYDVIDSDFRRENDTLNNTEIIYVKNIDGSLKEKTHTGRENPSNFNAMYQEVLQNPGVAKNIKTGTGMHYDEVNGILSNASIDEVLREKGNDSRNAIYRNGDSMQPDFKQKNTDIMKEGRIQIWDNESMNEDNKESIDYRPTENDNNNTLHKVDSVGNIENYNNLLPTKLNSEPCNDGKNKHVRIEITDQGVVVEYTQCGKTEVGRVENKRQGVDRIDKEHWNTIINAESSGYDERMYVDIQDKRTTQLTGEKQDVNKESNVSEVTNKHNIQPLKNDKEEKGISYAGEPQTIRDNKRPFIEMFDSRGIRHNVTVENGEQIQFKNNKEGSNERNEYNSSLLPGNPKERGYQEIVSQKFASEGDQKTGKGFQPYTSPIKYGYPGIPMEYIYPGLPMEYEYPGVPIAYDYPSEKYELVYEESAQNIKNIGGGLESPFGSSETLGNSNFNGAGSQFNIERNDNIYGQRNSGFMSNGYSVGSSNNEYRNMFRGGNNANFESENFSGLDIQRMAGHERNGGHTTEIMQNDGLLRRYTRGILENIQGSGGFSGGIGFHGRGFSHSGVAGGSQTDGFRSNNAQTRTHISRTNDFGGALGAEAIGNRGRTFQIGRTLGGAIGAMGRIEGQVRGSNNYDTELNRYSGTTGDNIKEKEQYEYVRQPQTEAQNFGTNNEFSGKINVNEGVMGRNDDSGKIVGNTRLNPIEIVGKVGENDGEVSNFQSQGYQTSFNNGKIGDSSIREYNPQVSESFHIEKTEAAGPDNENFQNRNVGAKQLLREQFQNEPILSREDIVVPHVGRPEGRLREQFQNEPILSREDIVVPHVGRRGKEAYYNVRNDDMIDRTYPSKVSENDHYSNVGVNSAPIQNSYNMGYSFDSNKGGLPLRGSAGAIDNGYTGDSDVESEIMGTSSRRLSFKEPVDTFGSALTENGGERGIHFRETGNALRKGSGVVANTMGEHSVGVNDYVLGKKNGEGEMHGTAGGIYNPEVKGKMPLISTEEESQISLVSENENDKQLEINSGFSRGRLVNGVFRIDDGEKKEIICVEGNNGIGNIGKSTARENAQGNIQGRNELRGSKMSLNSNSDNDDFGINRNGLTIGRSGGELNKEFRSHNGNTEQQFGHRNDESGSRISASSGFLFRTGLVGNVDASNNKEAMGASENREPTLEYRFGGNSDRNSNGGFDRMREDSIRMHSDGLNGDGKLNGRSGEISRTMGKVPTSEIMGNIHHNNAGEVSLVGSIAQNGDDKKSKLVIDGSPTEESGRLIYNAFRKNEGEKGEIIYANGNDAVGNMDKNNARGEEPGNIHGTNKVSSDEISLNSNIHNSESGISRNGLILGRSGGELNNEFRSPNRNIEEQFGPRNDESKSRVSVEGSLAFRTALGGNIDVSNHKEAMGVSGNREQALEYRFGGNIGHNSNAVGRIRGDSIRMHSVGLNEDKNLNRGDGEINRSMERAYALEVSGNTHQIGNGGESKMRLNSKNADDQNLEVNAADLPKEGSEGYINNQFGVHNSVMKGQTVYTAGDEGSSSTKLLTGSFREIVDRKNDGMAGINGERAGSDRLEANIGRLKATETSRINGDSIKMYRPESESGTSIGGTGNGEAYARIDGSIGTRGKMYSGTIQEFMNDNHDGANRQIDEAHGETSLMKSGGGEITNESNLESNLGVSGGITGGVHRSGTIKDAGTGTFTGGTFGAMNHGGAVEFDKSFSINYRGGLGGGLISGSRSKEVDLSLRRFGEAHAGGSVEGGGGFQTGMMQRFKRSDGVWSHGEE